MSLVLDAMLGRLARWLRALGHDVLFDPSIHDDELARLALAQNRLLVTRDRRLCLDRGAPEWCVLIEAITPAAQLSELDRRLGLFPADWRDRLFTRCLICNTPLDVATLPAVGAALPAEVRADPRVRSTGYQQCHGCGRVYWEGSHTRRMRRWLEGVSRRERKG